MLCGSAYARTRPSGTCRTFSEMTATLRPGSGAPQVPDSRIQKRGNPLLASLRSSLDPSSHHHRAAERAPTEPQVQLEAVEGNCRKAPIEAGRLAVLRPV